MNKNYCIRIRKTGFCQNQHTGKNGWFTSPLRCNIKIAKWLSKQFVIFVFSVISPALWALSGSLIDPDLSVQSENSDRLQGSFRMRVVRNLRINAHRENWFNTDYKDNVIGEMNIKSDLTFNHSLSKRYSLFVSLDYTRKTFSDELEVKNGCWWSHLCVGNMSLGVSSPFLKKGNLNLNSSIYLNLPTSRHSIKQSVLGGLGALLNTNWQLASNMGFKLFVVSNHFLDLYAYSDRRANHYGTRYNTPLILFNQPGFRFHYSGPVPVFSKKKNRRIAFQLKSMPWLIPDFYVYGSHRFSLKANGSPRHLGSLSASATWTVKKKLRIAAGLKWENEIFAPEGTKKRVIGNRRVADWTNFTLGASYAFGSSPKSVDKNSSEEVPFITQQSF